MCARVLLNIDLSSDRLSFDQYIPKIGKNKEVIGFEKSNFFRRSYEGYKENKKI